MPILGAEAFLVSNRKPFAFSSCGERPRLVAFTGMRSQEVHDLAILSVLLALHPDVADA